MLFCITLPFIPYWVGNISGLVSLSCLQCVVFLPGLCAFGMETVCFKHVSITKRFTILATTFGIAAAVAFGIVSFSLIPLTKFFDHYSLWVIYVPALAALLYGLNYIEKLEKKTGKYFNYPDEDNLKYPDSASSDKQQKYDFDKKEEYAAYDATCEYSSNLLNIISYQSQRQNKKTNIKLIEKAIIFTKKWHDGQIRDNGEPFYSHPLAVAGIVAEYYCKTDVVIGAILHDVIEDSDGSIELVVKEFNERIAAIVSGLTKVRVIDSYVIKLSAKEVIEELCQKNDHEALFIKQIDRLHNLHTIGNRPREKQIKVATESNDYLVTSSAYAADKLGIDDGFTLEDRIFNIAKTF